MAGRTVLNSEPLLGADTTVMVSEEGDAVPGVHTTGSFVQEELQYIAEGCASLDVEHPLPVLPVKPEAALNLPNPPFMAIAVGNISEGHISASFLERRSYATHGENTCWDEGE